MLACGRICVPCGGSRSDRYGVGDLRASQFQLRGRLAGLGADAAAAAVGDCGTTRRASPCRLVRGCRRRRLVRWAVLLNDFGNDCLRGSAGCRTPGCSRRWLEPRRRSAPAATGEAAATDASSAGAPGAGESAGCLRRSAVRSPTAMERRPSVRALSRTPRPRCEVQPARATEMCGPTSCHRRRIDGLCHV